MAALSPVFATPFCLFSCRPPNHRLCFQLRPHLVVSCSASTGRARASRKLMSDADLRKGLREFVSSFGFPDGHVPSTKELAKHGRKDLANIVRRRGYKFIRELLANSSSEVTVGSKLEDSSAEEQNVAHGLECDVKGQDTHDKVVAEMALYSADGVSSIEDKLQIKTESVAHLDNENGMPIVPPNCSSFQEKVEKFLKCGILDYSAVDDNITGNFWRNDSQAHREYIKNSTGSDSSIQGEANSREASDRNFLLNGSAVISKQIANSGDGGNIMRDSGYLSHEVLTDTDVDQYINTLENKAAVVQLKNKLQLKELELSQMKELVEKEEEALSILQSQAEDEIRKTEKLISEMDAELLAAEDSLAGLKEVQIQYLGEGQLVEVAGSFNGWHQRIRLDPQPSSTGQTLAESRNLTLWSALLWLYPGEYEIKFVVDGEWKIDPDRETTTRTGMQNNILRVDR